MDECRQCVYLRLCQQETVPYREECDRPTLRKQVAADCSRCGHMLRCRENPYAVQSPCEMRILPVERVLIGRERVSAR